MTDSNAKKEEESAENIADKSVTTDTEDKVKTKEKDQA